jgi:hypothetical protein
MLAGDFNSMEEHMRKTGKKFGIALFVALIGLAVGNGAALANESVDNTFPGSSSTYYGNPSWYVCSVTGGCSFGGGYFGGSLMEISPSGDVDYLVAACGNGTVTSVSIDISSGGGDLDLYVYKPNGTYIGSSTGTGTTETVNTSSASMNAVVMKVYGYGTATGGYWLTIYCSA